MFCFFTCHILICVHSHLVNYSLSFFLPWYGILFNENKTVFIFQNHMFENHLSLSKKLWNISISWYHLERGWKVTEMAALESLHFLKKSLKKYGWYFRKTSLLYVTFIYFFILVHCIIPLRHLQVFNFLSFFMLGLSTLTSEIFHNLSSLVWGGKSRRVFHQNSLFTDVLGS